jgi:hypothetical protein
MLDWTIDTGRFVRNEWLEIRDSTYLGQDHLWEIHSAHAE